MKKFLFKMKKLKTDTKYIFITILFSLIFWLFSSALDSYFKNILFSFLFILTPYMAIFLYEKMQKKLSKINHSIFYLLSVGIINFFIFMIFSPAVLNQGSISLAFKFGFYGFILSIILNLNSEFIYSNILFVKNKILNSLIIGMVLYFVSSLALNPVFFESYELLYHTTGFQLIIKLLFQSITLGSVYTLIILFIKDSDYINKAIDLLLEVFNLKEKEEINDSSDREDS